MILRASWTILLVAACTVMVLSCGSPTPTERLGRDFCRRLIACGLWPEDLEEDDCHIGATAGIEAIISTHQAAIQNPERDELCEQEFHRFYACGARLTCDENPAEMGCTLQAPPCATKAEFDAWSGDDSR